MILFWEAKHFDQMVPQQTVKNLIILIYNFPIYSFTFRKNINLSTQVQINIASLCICSL